MNSSFSTTLGDLANGVILAVSLLYAATVIYFTQQPDQSFFDETWKQDGFCIQNKDVPYWSSFDKCLYVDTFFSVVLAWMWYRWRNVEGMAKASELVPFVVLGTLGHGYAHGMEAAKFRRGEIEEEGGAERSLWQDVVFGAIFWFPLLKASLYNEMSNRNVAWLTVVVCAAGSKLRDEYGFTYVQTVLAMAYHVSQLLLPRKEKEQHAREYLMLPVVTAVLPLITAWNEALFCQTYFRAAGGHVLYDASIILGFIAFYLDSYRYYTAQKKNKQV